MSVIWFSEAVLKSFPTCSRVISIFKFAKMLNTPCAKANLNYWQSNVCYYGLSFNVPYENSKSQQFSHESKCVCWRCPKFIWSSGKRPGSLSIVKKCIKAWITAGFKCGKWVRVYLNRISHFSTSFRKGGRRGENFKMCQKKQRGRY